MVLSTLRRVFHTYPLLSNVATTTTLFTAADALCQILEHKGFDNFNLQRLFNMTTMSAAYYGPVYFYYYRLLDRKFPGRNPRTIIVKMAIDQILFTIPSLALFFIGMGFLEGKTWKENMAELELKYIPTYLTSSTFWPVAQAMNFAVVPPMYRVTYISSMTLVWMTLLSYIKNRPKLPTFLVRVKEVSDDVQKRLKSIV